MTWMPDYPWPPKRRRPRRYIDDDGYEVVPPIPEYKGQRCGLCGMTFEAGKAYGMVCYKPRCPMFTQITY